MTNQQTNPARRRALLQGAVAALILLCAVLLATWLLKTPPKARQRHHTRVAPLVEVVTARSGHTALRLNALATVVADQAVTLTPRVAGQVQSVSAAFTPGGFFAKGATMLTIDPEDYRLALTRQRGQVAEARAALNLEMGNQLVAKKEFELLGRKVTRTERNLMLRGPQLEAARATLTAAKAELAMAKRDLADTRVRAPFNATVLNREVNRGSRVSTATALAQLVGTDSFLLRITLPQEQLKWLSDDPGQPSPVAILSDGIARRGVITNITSSLDETSRMAVVYARIDDPLCLKKENKGKPQLRLGSLVKVVLGGPVLKEMVVIDRSLLHGDNTVRLLDDNNRLTIREVTIAAREGKKLFLSSGVVPGDRLITTSLSAPVEQMEVTVAEGEPQKKRRGEEKPQATPLKETPPQPAPKQPESAPTVEAPVPVPPAVTEGATEQTAAQPAAAAGEQKQ